MVTTWSTIDLRQLGVLLDVVEGGPGLVAVGERSAAPGASTVWVSADGSTWDAAPEQDSLARGVMRSVAAGPGGFVAVGRPCSDGDGGACTAASIWASGDGRTWTAVEVPALGGMLDLSSVVVLDGRYYAGGTLTYAGVITSDDGRTWRTVWQDPAPEVAPNDLWPVGSVSAMTTFDGGLAASVFPGSTIRLSADGAAWRSVAGPEDAAWIDGLSAWRRGLVAVGYDRSDRGAIWLSDDGTVWKRVADLGASQPRAVSVSDGAAVVAAGSADGRPSILTSRDGETWAAAALADDVPSGTIATALLPFGDGFVGVGGTGGPVTPDLRVAIWHGPRPVVAGQVPPASAAPGSPAPSSTGAPSLGGALLWERAPDQAALADAGMSAIAVGPDRYVAVGCATTGEFDASTCSGAAWVSSDGRSWERTVVPSAEPLYLEGVIWSPIGYLAWAYDVGASPGAAIWVSPDGRQWQRAPTIPSFSFNHVFEVVWFQDRFVAQSDWNEKRVWVSDDGLAWHDQTDTIGCHFQSGPAGPDPFGDSVHLMVVGDEFLRVGTAFVPADPSVYPGTQEYFRVITRVSDGRCTHSNTVSDGWILDVAQSTSGFIGVGRQHDPVGSGAGSPPPPIAAWVSPDGVSWVAASLGSKPPNGSLELVASGDRGILALGDTESGYSQWRSVDGATWSGSKGSLKELSDLAAIPGGFIAVGRETLASGKVRAAIWIAR